MRLSNQLNPYLIKLDKNSKRFFNYKLLHKIGYWNNCAFWSSLKYSLHVFKRENVFLNKGRQVPKYSYNIVKTNCVIQFAKSSPLVGIIFRSINNPCYWTKQGNRKEIQVSKMYCASERANTIQSHTNSKTRSPFTNFLVVKCMR